MSLQKLFDFDSQKVSAEKALADEIYEVYKLPYPRIFGMIKYDGLQCVRECFLESRKAPQQPAIGLFIWLLKKNKTKWQPQPKEVKTERAQDGLEVWRVCMDVLMDQGRTREEAMQFLKDG